MRILLTSFPAYGHVNPMLPLARQTQQAGHDVAVAAGLLAAYPDLMTLPRDGHLQRAVSAMMVPAAAARAVELVPRAREWKPDVVVHELFEPAGALVAAHTGARHSPSPLSLPQRSACSPTPVSRSLRLVSEPRSTPCPLPLTSSPS